MKKVTLTKSLIGAKPNQKATAKSLGLAKIGDCIVHKDDAVLLTDTQKNVYSLFFDGTFTARPVEKVFSDGDEIELAGETVKVIHTPGHTEGSSCFLCENALITGDTLFSAGVGRTDFIGGSERKLYDSLKKLRGIEGGSKITIYPGHGKTNILSAALDNFIY